MSGAVIIGIALVGLVIDVCALKLADAVDERGPLGTEDDPWVDNGDDEGTIEV